MEGYQSRIVGFTFVAKNLVGENGRVQAVRQNGYGYCRHKRYFRVTQSSWARLRAIANQKIENGEWGKVECEDYQIANEGWLPEEEQPRIKRGKHNWRLVKPRKPIQPTGLSPFL